MGHTAREPNQVRPDSKSSRATEAEGALTEFLLALEIAVFGPEAAMTYGRVRAELARRGTPIGPLDTIIGAHALAIDAILVSHNTREFGRIEGLRLVAVLSVTRNFFVD